MLVSLQLVFPFRRVRCQVLSETFVCPHCGFSLEKNKFDMYSDSHGHKLATTTCLSCGKTVYVGFPK